MPAPNISRQFAAVIRKRRLLAGLSQEILAERADVHATYVSMLERGVRKPTLEIAARLARALDIPLPKLIEEAQSKRKQSGGNSAGRRGTLTNR